MNVRSRKALLMFLVIPAGLGWLWLCIIGSLVFTHAMFSDWPSFLMSVMALTGLACTSIAIWSVFKYPKISKVSIIAFGLGFIALIAGGIVGFATSFLYYISVAFLGWAGIMVTNEYCKNT